MTAKIPVNPRTLNADYHSQVQACPVWTWGIAIHASRIATDLDKTRSVFFPDICIQVDVTSVLSLDMDAWSPRLFPPPPLALLLSLP